MLKLVVSVCLLGVAGLVLVGGCTPEADETWSESTDFSDLEAFFQDMSGTYAITNDLDGRFTWLTLYQTGSSLQGFDNMRRSWSGSMNAQGQINLQTNDGPGGQAIIVGNAVWLETTTGEGEEATTTLNRSISGVFYYGEKSGRIYCVGPSEVAAEEE